MRSRNGHIAHPVYKHLGHRLAWVQGVSTIALIAALTLFHGCVEAAECDQSTPCSSDLEVCFKFECLPRCSQQMACAQGALCISCADDDACFGVSASACVQSMAKEGG